MKNHITVIARNCRLALFALLITATVCASAIAQGTGFTYQGRLNDGGIAANGNYDFQFDLFDAANGGSQIGSSVTNMNVSVANGIFTVTLDFGASSFPGANRFLEISVRAAGSLNPRTLLTPRQPVTSAPYALRSLTATAADATVNFSGALVGDVTGTQGATVVSSVGGQTASNVATAIVTLNSATANNTGSTLVERDGIGSFSANVVNASSYSIAGSPVVRVSGSGTNTHLGPFAGSSVSSGTNNTFVGTSAGSNFTTGSNNTFLGIGTGGIGTLNNITVIGAGSLATQSNSLILGGVNGQNGVTTDTNVGIGTSAPAARFDIGVNGTHVLIGDAGCNSGFAGLGFKVLSGCQNFSLLGNGADTIVNRPGSGKLFFRENNSDQMTIAPGGLVGIGTTTPKALFEVFKDAGGQLGPSVLIMNPGAVAGTGGSLDFESIETGISAPTARIQNINEGNLSDAISFQTKAPGGLANPLVERVRISSTGLMTVAGNSTVGGQLTVGTGISHDGGGVKHARVNIPLTGQGNIFINVFWPTPFADTNYTVVATIEDTNPGQNGVGLTVRAVTQKSAGSVDLAINNTSTDAHTGVIHLIAIHD